MPPRRSKLAAPIPAEAPEPAKPTDVAGLRSLAAPAWAIPVILGLAALLLLSLFTGPAGDTDTWWHLKSGQYIVEQHRLPAPDPFSWTTYTGPPAYPGEETTRYFNLTHEWLSQVMFYSSYAAGGFAGLILMRALWLTAFCAIAATIAYRRTRSHYRALAVAFAAASVVLNFAADRPQYITYVFLAATILILESRRRLWLLPILFVIWANCHAGFIMGWVVMGAYCAEALYCRLRGKPTPDERRLLWSMCIGAMLISVLNPNGLNVVPVLGYYRQSLLQSQIWEWQRPKYWELSPFTILLYSGAALLLLNVRRSRPVEWLLLAAFAVSSLMAMRNIFLIGLWCPILIATYLPTWDERNRARAGWAAALGIFAVSLYYLWTLVPILMLVPLALAVYLLVTKKYQAVAVGLLALLLAAGVSFRIAKGRSFQFRGDAWKEPAGAANFLLKHHIKGRIFNTYGQGGYLIWRLWPEQQVFLDGRALNEKVWQDANRINMNAASRAGKSGEELLKEYGIDVIVMEMIEPVAGTVYYLPVALADPSQKEWKLVFADHHDVVFMRNPPPDISPLNSLNALDAMEQQCYLQVKHGLPLCSRGLADVFKRVGDRERQERWAAVYQQFQRAGAEIYTVVH